MSNRPNTQKKLIIFSTFFYPSIGGVEKYVYEIASRLHHEHFDIEIITCATNNGKPREIINGIEIVRLESWNLLQGYFPIPKFSVSNLRILRDAISADPWCIISNTRFYPLTLVAALVSKLARRPILHIEHGSTHSVFPNSLVSGIAQVYDHTIGSLIVKYADYQYGVSKSVADFLAHLGGKNPGVMYGGIDISNFDGAEPIPSLVTDRSMKILFLGRLIFSKRVQDLIGIYPDLSGEVKLYILGDGPEKIRLEVQAKNIARNNIILVGQVDPGEIPAYLKSVDIFVNPSYSEGLPTSVLEACAAGCAVVASDTGGTREIITDGVNGFLIRPGDTHDLKNKINLLIKDAPRRKAFGEQAREQIIKKFSWDTTLDRYLEILNSTELSKHT